MKLSQVKYSLLAILFSVNCLNTKAVVLPPTIKFVSIDPLTNNITISWYKSLETNVDSLFITHLIKTTPSPKGAPKILYYTQYNTDNSYTVNVLQIPAVGTSTIKGVLSFAIDAKKSGQSSTNLSFYHSTIFATATFQNCPNRNLISWKKYYGTKPDINGNPIKIIVNKYNIYKAEISGNVLIGSVSGNDSIFYHSISQGNGQFDYFVEAELVDAKGVVQKSTSNLASTNVILPKFPSFLTGNTSEVLTNDSLKLSFNVDFNSDISQYRLFKSDQLKGTYSAVNFGYKMVNAWKQILYYDTTKSVGLTQSFYKLSAVDDCGDTVMITNVISNIVLTAEKSGSSNVISWVGFYEWPLGINRYELYRSIDKQEPYLTNTENNVSGNVFTFTDVMDLLSGKGNEQCYYVTAIPNEEPSGKIFSKSNKVCIKQEDRVFIPDAFNPVSKVVANKTFRPIIAFVNTDNYQFSVYNRLGEKIFATNDPNVGWDGLFKNEMVAEGSYIYYVKYNNSDGNPEEKRGTFFVVFSE